jgi:hypothetical protein
MKPKFTSRNSATVAPRAGFVIPESGDLPTAGDAYAGQTRCLVTGISQSATIAAGVVTLDGPWVSLLMVDTESAAASDDLDTISGGTEGQRLTLNPVNAARTVVVKDGTGNLRTAGDHSMDHAQDTVTLVFSGSAWLESGRANNNT